MITQQHPDDTEPTPDYGMHDYGCAHVFVEPSGVTMVTVPKFARNITDARRLEQKMTEAAAFFEQQSTIYGAFVTAKLVAEREARKIERRRGQR